MKARKPIESTIRYMKYGFVHVERKMYRCPKCGELLSAGPDYQPKYCGECGQKLDFSDAKWESEKILGYKEEESWQRETAGDLLMKTEYTKKAVKMRKMTDQQLVRYVEDRVAKAHSEGFNKGKAKASVQRGKGAKEFIAHLQMAKIPGIGAVTINKILKVAEENGYL